jgi:putative two-component system response regulator
MDKKPRILICDDEIHITKLMETILVPQGYDVCKAHDGKEALEMVDKCRPDLVLMDIMMPILDGFEVTKTLKERPETQTIPVVIVSAAADKQRRLKALELGADDFLTKPVDTVELKARVKSLLKVKAYNDHMRQDKLELEMEVAKRTDQLKMAFEKIKLASLEVIFRLSRAAEFRDRGTGDHIKRMSHYAAALARKLGHNQEVVEAILYATPMHDIGKIGIPDSILLKPGRHDPAEWDTMRQHTRIGARIVEGSDYGFIKLAGIIALTHHEHWDGGGYPFGLRGAQIPAVGRITTVADVFDAMTTSRPYRLQPIPVEEAFAYIKESAGTHFDPEMAGAFLAMREEVLNIKEQFSDNGGHDEPAQQ